MQRSVIDGIGRSAALVLLASPPPMWTGRAAAVPSFGAQTSQPGVAFHIGSFGPSPAAKGRVCKLGGCTAAENPDEIAASSIPATSSFTRTNTGQPGGAGHGDLVDKQGRFTMRCSVHPRMKMTINVQ